MQNVWRVLVLFVRVARSQPQTCTRTAAHALVFNMLASVMLRGVRRAAVAVRSNACAVVQRGAGVRRCVSRRAASVMARPPCDPAQQSRQRSGVSPARTGPGHVQGGGCGYRALSTSAVEQALAEAMAEAAARVPHLQAVAHKLRELVETQKQVLCAATACHRVALASLCVGLAQISCSVSIREAR